MNATDIVNGVLKLSETISHGEDDASPGISTLTAQANSNIITWNLPNRIPASESLM